MGKFKIGDKVKVITCPYANIKKGEVRIVKEFRDDHIYCTQLDGKNSLPFYDFEIKSVEQGVHRMENHPPMPTEVQIGGDHYKNAGGIQPIDFIMSNDIPFAEGNAIKYIFRHRKKNGFQDLLKAKHYIDFIIQRDYKDEANAKATA